MGPPQVLLMPDVETLRFFPNRDTRKSQRPRGYFNAEFSVTTSLKVIFMSHVCSLCRVNFILSAGQ
jgi:hypothetical protein